MRFFLGSRKLERGSRRPRRRQLPEAVLVRLLSALAVTVLLQPAAHAEDWPQFRGPERSGSAAAEGLLESWPEDGLKVVWRRPLGAGFSGVAVVGESLFTLFAEGDSEVAGSFDAKDGAERWRRVIGETFVDQWGNGPRATPTVDGELLYAVSSKGQLHALRAATGEVVWKVDFPAELGKAERSLPAPNAPVDGPPSPDWGHCSSPLVEGDLVIAFTAAGSGKSLAAFDKRTGELRWSRFDHAHAHASPIAVTAAGRRQIVLTMAEEILGVSLDGELLWRHPWAVFSIASPLFVPPDRIFVSAPNDVGALLLRLVPGEAPGGEGDVGGFRVEEVWREPFMRNNWQSSVVRGDSIVGFDNATLKTLSTADASLRWAQRGLGKGTLVLAGELLITLSDQGRLTAARFSPEAFERLGQMQVLNGPTWTAPSPAGGKLYLRNHEELVCLDLRK